MIGPRFIHVSPEQLVAMYPEPTGQPNRKFRRAANSLAVKKIRKAKKAAPLALHRAAVAAFRKASDNLPRPTNPVGAGADGTEPVPE